MYAEILFSDKRKAENFRRFVNRQPFGVATRRHNMVIIEDTTPDEIRTLFAKSGYIGDVRVTNRP